MVADLRKMQENQWVSEIQTDKREFKVVKMDLLQTKSEYLVFDIFRFDLSI